MCTHCYTVHSRATQSYSSCNFPPSSNLFRRFRSLAKAKKKEGQKQKPDLISHCSCCRYRIRFLNIYRWLTNFSEQPRRGTVGARAVRTVVHRRRVPFARYLLAMKVNGCQSNSNKSYVLLLHCTSIIIELERAKWAHLWHLSIVNDGAAIERRHGHETTVAI
jgi:hypothetical protein